MTNQPAPIDVIEDAIVDHLAGRITRADAIATIRSVVDVTERGAADLFDDAVAPRLRYELASFGDADLRRMLGIQ